VPYQRNADLPAPIRNALPGGAQNIFRRTVNAALGRGKDEKTAFQMEWVSVKQSFKPTPSGQWINKRRGTLYVKRNVENPHDIVKWARSQGFKTTIVPRDMHVTVSYSKGEVDWPEPDEDHVGVYSKRGRAIETLGETAVVLKFHSAGLHRRFDELIGKYECTHDFDEYVPHVTLTYTPGDVDLAKVKPYDGPIILGPETHEEIEDEVDHVEKYQKFHVLKVNPSLGLVFGWAIICKVNGKDYYDTQDDHIPEESMLKATAEFMEKRRTMKLMHKGEKAGEVVFAWPLTSQIAGAMGLTSKVSGLMVAVKPTKKSILTAIESGKLTGFSIGGQRIEDEEVE